MGSNKRRQHQLWRMFTRQGGRCAWCGRKMVEPGTYKGKGRPDPLLCTVDHLDCRFSEDRGKHAGEYRRVAACWTCNNRRAQMQQANVSKETLWEKSGAYPADIRPEGRFRRTARKSTNGVEQLARQPGEPQDHRGAGEARSDLGGGMGSSDLGAAD